jgi:hypothetical protein
MPTDPTAEPAEADRQRIAAWLASAMPDWVNSTDGDEIAAHLARYVAQALADERHHALAPVQALIRGAERFPEGHPRHRVSTDNLRKAIAAGQPS